MKPLLILSGITGAVALGLVIGVYAVTFYAIAEHHRALVAVTQPSIQPPTSNEVEAALNEFRVNRGLPTFFSDNEVLDHAAQVRAEGMCASDDWGHDKAWAVLNPLYTYALASENLYYGSLQANQAANAVQAWSESPSHLENMLRSHTEIGIGVKACPGYQGDATAIIITNYFGTPQ